MEEIKYCSCGQIATKQFKNGNWCCNEDHRKCPTNRKKYSNQGDKNPIFGTTRSKETRDKIAKKAFGRTPWNVGVKPYNKGKSLIEMYGEDKAKEIKEKRSKSVSKTMLNNGGGLYKRSRFLQGWFYSKKMKKDIYYQSSYELAFYRILERSDNVLYFDRPKFAIPYFINGIKHLYHPDVITIEKDFDSFRVYEIKPENENELELNQLKWKAAEDFGFENNLFLFTILNESSFKKELKLVYKEFLLK